MRADSMRILVSDYSGHPFQVQLSRGLARRGYEVRHVFSAGFQTPKGNLARQSEDPPRFSIVGLKTRKPFAKATFFRRRRQEIEFGKLLANEVVNFKPDTVISSNAPIDAQDIFRRASQMANARFIFWLQDIWSDAITRVVPARIPVAGHAIAAYYRNLEFRTLRASDQVVTITQDFVPILESRGVERDKTKVIENWAPLDELVPRGRNNAWARKHMAHGDLRIVYSGTLGYKHNPELLLRIAKLLPTAHVYVFSEGEVADALSATAKAEGLSNVTVDRWVAFADLPYMLSGADIFVAMLEADAGVYSVPSKILTYLAIGRPVLASMPAENLAARLIRNNDAGCVASPDDPMTLLEYARSLSADQTQRKVMGDNGRAYAARTFDLDMIVKRFESLIGRV